MPTPAGHDVNAGFREAQALWQDGQVESTRLLLEQILARQPQHADAAALLARLLQSQGLLERASAVMAASCRHLGLDANATLRCAQFIRQSQRQQLAAQLCEESIARGNATGDLYALAGNIYRELGDFDAARRHFLAALRAKVDLDTWFVPGALVATQRYATLDHPDVEQLIEHFRQARSSPRARAASGFGLAKVYDDVGEYAKASDVLREANALVRSEQAWSRDAWEHWIQARCRDQGRGEHSAGPPPRTQVDWTPIFVVGLPRSGTTLTAVQLARYAGVRDRGELPHIPYIAERLEASGRARDPEALREAADLYSAHLRQDDAPARWYVDNNQMNFRHLDLIARLFPRARVIHCVRNRRDTALSIWSQYFAHSACAFANDLDDIAAFSAGHDRLMQHWKKNLDLPIHTVVYEDMVEHGDDVGEHLREFVGLPAVIATRERPTQGQVITSASMWQARQPVYRSSIARWRAYAPFMPELERLFPDAGQAGGQASRC
ncbi:MAG TPA: sulfotransferase [Rhodanobacteraceae bacterium]|jgi:tetratricopeptide (TPR) repeat protein|nr:sulfotransferase [Rhodanobacteraceae bacterium]